MGRRVLVGLVALLFALGWAPQISAPPRVLTCIDIFRATTRGGASPLGEPTAAGGGCTPFLPSRSSATPVPIGVLVVQVIDGDTIVIEGGERVRYIGVDTPELEPNPAQFAREARDLNRSLVEGKRVVLEKDISDRDRFGRLLRYVYVGRVLVNAELVREGAAVALPYPPDTRYQGCLSAVQREAVADRRGVWK